MNLEQLRSRVAAIKAENPDWNCVAFVNGPWFEFLDDDAKVIAKTLGVVLSHRGSAKDVPSCSVPVNVIQRHANRLQAAGILVGIEYPETSGSADAAQDDARPVEWGDLSEEQKVRLAAGLQELEKRELRAAALLERLTEYGLTSEAKALGVAAWADYMDVHKLDALEAIIGTIEEAGGVPPSQTRQ